MFHTEYEARDTSDIINILSSVRKHFLRKKDVFLNNRG